jgi:hypothetical protein
MGLDFKEGEIVDMDNHIQVKNGESWQPITLRELLGNPKSDAVILKRLAPNRDHPNVKVQTMRLSDENGNIGIRFYAVYPDEVDLNRALGENILLPQVEFGSPGSEFYFEKGLILMIKCPDTDCFVPGSLENLLRVDLTTKAVLISTQRPDDIDYRYLGEVEYEKEDGTTGLVWTAWAGNNEQSINKLEELYDRVCDERKCKLYRINKDGTVVTQSIYLRNKEDEEKRQKYNLVQIAPTVVLSREVDLRINGREPEELSEAELKALFPQIDDSVIQVLLARGRIWVKCPNYQADKNMSVAYATRYEHTKKLEEYHKLNPQNTILIHFNKDDLYQNEFVGTQKQWDLRLKQDIFIGINDQNKYRTMIKHKSGRLEEVGFTKAIEGYLVDSIEGDHKPKTVLILVGREPVLKHSDNCRSYMLRSDQCTLGSDIRVRLAYSLNEEGGQELNKYSKVPGVDFVRYHPQYPKR